MKFFTLAVVTFALFLVLDFLWFRVAGEFFKSQVGSIARLRADGSWDVLLWAGALAYVLMTIGVLVFVVLQAGSLWQAAALGALFGFVAYGIYDFTNLATLSAWTVRFVVVDVLWGTLLCGTVSAVAYALANASLWS